MTSVPFKLTEIVLPQEVSFSFSSEEHSSSECISSADDQRSSDQHFSFSKVKSEKSKRTV